jgi:RNA polymerase sigma-70 factor (ECF subfamily)
MRSSQPAPDGREERVRLGDREALASLLQEQSGSLHGWIARRLDRRLQGRVSASDVVQEVYLAAEQRLDHFGRREAMPFGIWLRLIAGQRMADLHRQYLHTLARDASRELPIEAGSGPNAVAAGLAGDLTSPSQIVARREATERIAVTMDRLAPADREVLMLRHYEGLSNDAVAARLGLTKSAATKRYIRALRRFARALEGNHPSASGPDTDEP